MRLFLLVYALIFPACLIYMLPLERPANFWARFLGSTAMCLLPGVLFGQILMSRPGTSLLWTIFSVTRPLWAFGVILVVVGISLGPRWAEVVYCGIWAYLTREFCFDFSQIILPFLMPQNSMGEGMMVLLNLLCHSLVYLAAFLLIARNLPVDQHYNGGTTLLRMPLLLTALVTVVKPVARFANQNGTGYNVFIFVQVICTFFVMAALYAQRLAEKRISVQRELETQRLLWRQHEKQMEEARQKTELLNCKYHDLKHYIAAIRDQLQGEAGIAALDELERSVRVFDSSVRTGNEVLDTILTEKKMLCEQRNITMTCVADGALLRNMNTVDVYAIFGNAIDNAVEYVSKLEDPEQKVITIAVFRIKGLVKIQIENYCTESLAFENDLPVTTKGDRDYHGYGLRSIRSMAEQYGGYMTVETKNGLFILHILLPANQVAGDENTGYEEKATS